MKTQTTIWSNCRVKLFQKPRFTLYFSSSSNQGTRNIITRSGSTILSSNFEELYFGFSFINGIIASATSLTVNKFWLVCVFQLYLIDERVNLILILTSHLYLNEYRKQMYVFFNLIKFFFCIIS